MKKYVIVTDTGSDLGKKYREQFDIEYIPVHISVDGVDSEADLDWQFISAKGFYDAQREGKRFITAQVNVEGYKAAFKKYIEQGYDILSLSTSSSISASINASRVAKEELAKEYPDAKIYCIDTLRASYALGLIVLRASELRAEGKTIEEVAQWVEDNKQTVNMIGSVDSLVYLKRAGRVSAASAFFGGLLNIKPIIIADAQGRNFAVSKVKGRQTSIDRIAEMCAEAWDEKEYQRVFVAHADCLEDAEKLKEAIFEKLGKEIEVEMDYIGLAVGSAVGPGMLSVFFFGKEVTLNKLV